MSLRKNCFAATGKWKVTFCSYNLTVPAPHIADVKNISRCERQIILPRTVSTRSGLSLPYNIQLGFLHLVWQGICVMLIKTRSQLSVLFKYMLANENATCFLLWQLNARSLKKHLYKTLHHLSQQYNRCYILIMLCSENRRPE